jgi:hypothetical protein
MNVISFNIDFGTMSYKGNKAIFPFAVVYQTQSKKIEQYCQKTWPKLMTHEIYTPEDNLQKYKMYSYIKNNLTSSDLNDLHKTIYERNWMSPLDFNDKISTIEITEYGCKTWSDPNIPYLELKGIIIIDMIDMFHCYIKKGWITFENKSGILSENPTIKINKSLPFIIRYNSSQTPFDIILKEVTKQLNTNGSALLKMIHTKIKIKDFAGYKKNITWGLDKSIINIEIKEKIKLLKDKALAEPIKYGLLGLGAHYLLRGK